MKIYIAGPMDGKPNHNEEAFRRAEALVRRRGHYPLVPHDIPAWHHEGDCPPGYAEGRGHSSCCWLRGDIEVLITCEAVYLLEGWERSRGASLEHRIAVECGMTLFYEQGRSPIPYVQRTQRAPSLIPSLGEALAASVKGFTSHPATGAAEAEDRDPA